MKSLKRVINLLLIVSGLFVFLFHSVKAHALLDNSLVQMVQAKCGLTNEVNVKGNRIEKERLIITDNGDTEIRQSYRYDPFGDVEYSKGNSDNHLTFNGKEQDEGGLFYYGARYYNPVVGRWISQDPVVGTIFDPQNLNRYIFCKNNPLKYVDPDGRFVFVPALVAAGTAAVAWAETPAGQRAIGAGITIATALILEITKPKIETIEKVQTKDNDDKLPIYFVSKSMMPNIADNIEKAQMEGKPYVLTRATEAQKNQNRRNALKNIPISDPINNSRDEYPFASSVEGGSGARTAEVPKREQSIQGGTLSSFYQKNNIKPGSKYGVKVIE